MNQVEWCGRSDWEFACQWYKEDEVARFIQASKSIAVHPGSKIPEDIYSPEFAKWLTEQYRLAMAKGIQIGKGQDD